MAAAAILDFQKFEILTVRPLYGYNMRHVPNLIKIGQTVAEIWRFNGFFKWWSSAILDLLGAYWDHPRRPPIDSCMIVSIVVQNFVEIDAVVSIT